MFKTLKEHALNALKKNWVVAVIAVFCASIVPEILTVVYDYVNLENTIKFEEAFLALQENPTILSSPELFLSEMLALFNEYNASLTHEWLTWVASFVPFIFEMAIAGGFLTLIRTQKVTAMDFLSKFKLIGTGVLIAFIQTVAITLGAVFLIFPGIYLALAYSMVFYIKIDNPELSIRKCFKMSRELMRGKKLMLFNHFFSFIGWFILAGVASGFIANFLSMLKLELVGEILFVIISTLLASIVNAFWYTAKAFFYEFNFVRPPVAEPVHVHVVNDPFAQPADPFDGSTEPDAQQNTAPKGGNDDPFEF